MVEMNRVDAHYRYVQAQKRAILDDFGKRDPNSTPEENAAADEIERLDAWAASQGLAFHYHGDDGWILEPMSASEEQEYAAEQMSDILNRMDLTIDSALSVIEKPLDGSAEAQMKRLQSAKVTLVWLKERVPELQNLLILATD